MSKAIPIQEPKGKLGGVAARDGGGGDHFHCGLEAVRRKLGLPVGSLTQTGTIGLGKRTEKRVPPIQQFVPLASLDDLVFGGWNTRDLASPLSLKTRAAEQETNFPPPP